MWRHPQVRPCPTADLAPGLACESNSDSRGSWDKALFHLGKVTSSGLRAKPADKAQSLGLVRVCPVPTWGGGEEAADCCFLWGGAEGWGSGTPLPLLPHLNFSLQKC